MDINNIGGSLNLVPPGGARRVEVRAPAEVSVPVPQPQPQTAPEPRAANSDAARLESLRAAAQSAIRNFFAVSDTTFTIFKDSSGQYITRIKSLRDGTIKTYPEQNAFDFFRVQKPITSFSTEA